MTKKKRNILLLEPNYKNKYPPIGLMKLATYHRMLGDNVVFYKGDLKEFVLNNLYNDLILKLNKINKKVLWQKHKLKIIKFIRTGKEEIIYDLIYLSKYDKKNIVVYDLFLHYKEYYRKKKYFKNPFWDRVCITTLFTFQWKRTIETIEFAKKIVKNQKQIFVGGISATVLAKELENETGIKPHKGLLNKACDLDPDNNIIIDNLDLDYSILDEIEYKYFDNNAHYAYMTRGCIRKCSFCAVWKIEPKFNNYIPIKNNIEKTNEKYGGKKNLLLLDNNVLAKFREPNYLDIAVSNLKKGINDKAYINKSYEQLHYLLDILKEEKLKKKLYKSLEHLNLLDINTSTKKNILKIYPKVKDIFEKYRKKSLKFRYVDFNQGIDARLLTEEKMKLISEIPIRPMRIAFDSMKYEKIYVEKKINQKNFTKD